MKKSTIQTQHLISVYLDLVMDANDTYLSKGNVTKPNKEDALIINDVCEDVLNGIYGFTDIKKSTYLENLSVKIDDCIGQFCNSFENAMTIKFKGLILLIESQGANSEQALKLIQSMERILKRENRYFLPNSIIEQVIQKSKTIVRHNYKPIKQ